MIERLHEHMLQELRQNARNETVFVLLALGMNLLLVSVNSALAGSDSPTDRCVFVVLILLAVVINGIALIGLRRGEKIKATLLRGLLRLYTDQGIERYYNSALLSSYSSRYRLYQIGILATGLAGLLIPLIVMFGD
ncbi:MAG: hypothetical protein KatS3mg115_0998 [Candidatus Poribacteria bacterium]|nr:MAG: hypothetical protein KatS3mg115_0998 [Candidatus Poribacteria bacterium]